MKSIVTQLFVFLVALFLTAVGLMSAFLIVSNILFGKISPWRWETYWRLNYQMYIGLIALPCGLSLTANLFRRRITKSVDE